MLLLDDIALFPMRGILWVFRELHNAAMQELANEADSITNDLSQLYMMLERGEIPEAEFAARERELLERLEKIQQQTTSDDASDEQPQGRVTAQTAPAEEVARAEVARASSP